MLLYLEYIGLLLIYYYNNINIFIDYYKSNIFDLINNLLSIIIFLYIVCYIKLESQIGSFLFFSYLNNILMLIYSISNVINYFRQLNFINILFNILGPSTIFIYFINFYIFKSNFDYGNIFLHIIPLIKIFIDLLSFKKVYISHLILYISYILLYLTFVNLLFELNIINNYPYYILNFNDFITYQIFILYIICCYLVWYLIYLIYTKIIEYYSIKKYNYIIIDQNNLEHIAINSYHVQNYNAIV